VNQEAWEGAATTTNKKEYSATSLQKKRVPTEHPLPAIRKMVDEILKEMSPQFAKFIRVWDVRRSRRSGCAVAVVADLLFGAQ